MQCLACCVLYAVVLPLLQLYSRAEAFMHVQFSIAYYWHVGLDLSAANVPNIAGFAFMWCGPAFAFMLRVHAATAN